MKSRVVANMLDNTPAYIKNFNRVYSDLVVRVHVLMKEKGLSQNELARKLGKQPSEISKWLSGSGTHNLTLMSIAKLEAELGETLLYVPERKEYTNSHLPLKSSTSAQ